MVGKSKLIANGRRFFVLSLTGYSRGTSEIVKRDKQFVHRRNERGLFVLDICIEIGEGKNKIVIPKEYLEYSSSSYTIINIGTGDFDTRIEETVNIFTSSEGRYESSLWGTLELSLKVRENLNKDPEFFIKIGTVKGHGTGALKGVRVEGRDELRKKFDWPESPRGFAINYARVGSITGWPSEVTSWPPK